MIKFATISTTLEFKSDKWSEWTFFYAMWTFFTVWTFYGYFHGTAHRWKALNVDSQQVFTASTTLEFDNFVTWTFHNDEFLYCKLYIEANIQRKPHTKQKLLEIELFNLFLFNWFYRPVNVDFSQLWFVAFSLKKSFKCD